MKTEVMNIEHTGIRAKSGYGEQRIFLEYEVHTKTGFHIENKYTVTAKIAGIHTGDIELEVTHVIAHTNNECTKAAEEVADLLNWHYVNPTFEMEDIEHSKN